MAVACRIIEKVKKKKSRILKVLLKTKIAVYLEGGILPSTLVIAC